MALDVLIKNGYVIDGTGAPWFKADVGIMDGRIAEIGTISESGGRIIDAKGLVVCPGFIDIHSHSDWTFLFNPKADSKVRQGVTTELNGTCGMSGGPIPRERYKEFQLASSFVGFTCALIRRIEHPDWRTFGEFLTKVEKGGVPINTGYYVGHMNVRVAVMGLENREPTESELKEMKQLVDESMKSGAYGLSVALSHIPERFSKTDEVIELCKIVAKYGGDYAQHGRGAGTHADTREAIEIAEKSGVTAILSHHSPSPETEVGREDLRLMREARERGVDIIRDMILYGYGSSGPHSVLPYGVLKDGFEKAVERLKNPETRRKIKEDILSRRPRYPERLKRLVLLVAEKNRDLERKTWGEISRISDQDPLDAFLDVAAENNLSVKTISGALTLDIESAKRRIPSLRDPLTIPECDAGSLAPYGVLKDIGDARGYGTFPLLLGTFVRELKALTLEEAIRKITSFPAARMGLQDRGLLREGMCADITIFNPETVKAKATPLWPNQYPEGIQYVLVNGKVAVDNGKYTEVLAGKVLRH